MMQHIDVSSVLRQAVACDLYSNLVTRPTGAAVRAQIQALLREGPVRERPLTILDFTHVRMIDFSCADEVIAKLVLPYCEEGGESANADAYFLFRGVTEAHWYAIEAVLERHELALVLEEAGEVRVAGVVDEEEQRVWSALRRLGGGDAPGVAANLAECGQVMATPDAERLLARLHRRRLVMRLDDGFYLPVGPTANGHG